MKKTIPFISTVVLALAFGVAACGAPRGEQYTLPDLYNYTLKQAKLECGANVLFEETEVETTKLIEGRVLGYKDYEPGDKITKGSKIEIEVSKRVADSLTYGTNSIIEYSSVISKLTGPESQNADLCAQHGIGGTDLGIPFELPDGRMMLLYGDTFSGQNMQGIWHSNFMAITSDTDLSDGITFDEFVHNENNMQVIPFQEGAHQGGNATNRDVEVTKIPTGGISIGNDVYIFYMSIRYWGTHGEWNVTYNQCVKATDNTYKNWENVEGLRWDDTELFYAGQVYPFENPKDTEHIYFTSIPGGRNNGAIMFRVDVEDFENKAEYEYLTAANTWTKGEAGVKKLNSNPYYVMSPSVAEPSIAYNEYLDKFVYCTFKGGSIVLSAADNVTGPYNDVHTICDGSNFNGLYGGFLHPKFSDNGGQRIYMQLSRWTPIYNTYLMEIVLK